MWAKRNGYSGVKFYGIRGGDTNYINFVISNESTVKTMIKENYIKKFLFYIEWYYRNYGSTWLISDFPKDIIDHISRIESIYPELEAKGIIKISEDKLSIIILDLPSNYYNLF